jgi:hypothetical protein
MDFSTEHELRTADTTIYILGQVAKMSTDDGENLLKEHGLRNAPVSPLVSILIQWSADIYHVECNF